MGGIKKIWTNEGLASWIHEDSSVYRWEKAGSDKICKFKSENFILGWSVKAIKASLVVGVDYYLLSRSPVKN